MVGPDVAATLTEELDGAGIGHSIMSSNVQELIDASPKMAPYKSAAEGEYNMNWDDYQSLETIYDYLDYLEGTIRPSMILHFSKRGDYDEDIF